MKLNTWFCRLLGLHRFLLPERPACVVAYARPSSGDGKLPVGQYLFGVMAGNDFGLSGMTRMNSTVTVEEVGYVVLTVLKASDQRQPAKFYEVYSAQPPLAQGAVVWSYVGRTRMEPDGATLIVVNELPRGKVFFWRKPSFVSALVLAATLLPARAGAEYHDGNTRCSTPDGCAGPKPTPAPAPQPKK